MRVIFCFSGQGSHYYEMGRGLYEKDEVFRTECQALDRYARSLLSFSLIERIFSRPKKDSALFRDTLETHPGIVMIEYALAQSLISKGIVPDLLLGTSLGEFAAAALGGSVSPGEAVGAAIHQARVLNEFTSPGGMMAVLGGVEIFHNTPFLRNQVTLVGVNFDSHFVIAGEDAAISKAGAFLKEKGIANFHLPVSHGFHSPVIDPARDAFLEKVPGFGELKIPLLSCCYKKVIRKPGETFFWDVVRNPISFRETVLELEKNGPCFYIDVGPSGTLATFLNNLLPRDKKSQVYMTLNQFGNEEKTLSRLIQEHKNIFSRIHIPNQKKEEHKMLTYVFPGQGAQKKGMGADLFDRYSGLVAEADKILGYSLKDLCLEDPEKRLGLTQFTQPALYAVNALSYLAEVEDQGRKPDFMAGHSLGEYSALFAAGVFDFQTGIRLVQERGRLMGLATGGGMAAVIGLEDDEVRRILEAGGLNNIDVGNFNSPGQVVISGLKADIEKARPFFDSAKMYVPLAVSGAFHSRYMKDAGLEFEKFLEQFSFNPLSIPVISNVTARPYRRNQIKELLVKQIFNSVLWTDSIRYLMGKDDGMEYKELGQGVKPTLTGLITRIRKDAAPLVVDEEPAEELPAEEKFPAASFAPAEEKSAPAAGSFVPASGGGKILPETLGSAEFRKDYNIKYAYVSGAMYKGVASRELVVKMGKAGLMGFLGTGGRTLEWVEESIRYIQKELSGGESYGLNLLNNINDPDFEERTVDLYLKYGITRVEAAAYMQVSAPLLRFRLKGLRKNPDGSISINHKIIAKVSRPEVAASFLSPAPERMLQKMVEAGKLTSEEAAMGRKVPMADDICVEADSGGHTDMGVAYVLMPAMRRLRDDMMKEYGYAKKIRVGAAGGIGTPESAAAAFIMGAEFITTGSINQCSVESGTSDKVKDLLQQINVQDTEYAPAGDMFELGAKVQVLKKGVFFPARANKLYNLYTQYGSLEEIDAKTRQQLEEKYFKKTFDEIWTDTKAFFSKVNPYEIEKAEKNPKHKMALVFRWYFGLATRVAMDGDMDRKVDFQVHCGPALGAFNQWVKGTELEDWHNRHVDDIAERMMKGTAELLNRRFRELGAG